MNDENPFKTLGFHPQVFKNLHDAEIFSLVKAQYRALMQIHHPDVSKRRSAGETSGTISSAFAKVNLDSDPAGFNYWKDAFIKPERISKTKTVAAARSELSYTRERYLQDVVIDCLKAVYLTSPERPAKLPAEIATVNDGCAMVLEDMVKSQWMNRERIKKNNDSFQAKSALDATLFELETTKDGLMIRRNLVVHSLRIEDPSPPEGEAWIRRRDSVGFGHYWTTLSEKIRVVRGRVIGAISSNKLQATWDETGSETKRVIESGLSSEQTRIIESTGYTTDQVRPFVWLLSPELRVGYVVVSMAPTGDKFMFLGKLVMIADKSKAPNI